MTASYLVALTVGGARTVEKPGLVRWGQHLVLVVTHDIVDAAARPRFKLWPHG